MGVHWQNVTITLPRDDAEAFSDALIEEGAVSVNVEDADVGTESEKPIFGEPGATTGLWEQCKVTALFAEQDVVPERIASAAASLGLPRPAYSIETLDDIDWVARNREQFQPIRISARVWIVPSWHDVPAEAQIPIVLDPGAAFGTGSHPTTRMCLQWLEQTIPSMQSPSVIDYGCGSGILAIGARKFGAGKTIGVDIDPAAVEAARFNAQQNNEQIEFLSGDQTFDEVADVVVANILANPLRVLAPLLAARTKPGGFLALAGLLNEQAAELIDIYQPWFSLGIWQQDEGWSCLAGTRLKS